MRRACLLVKRPGVNYKASDNERFWMLCSFRWDGHVFENAWTTVTARRRSWPAREAGWNIQASALPKSIRCRTRNAKKARMYAFWPCCTFEVEHYSDGCCSCCRGDGDGHVNSHMTLQKHSDSVRLRSSIPIVSSGRTRLSCPLLGQISS